VQRRSDPCGCEGGRSGPRGGRDPGSSVVPRSGLGRISRRGSDPLPDRDLERRAILGRALRGDPRRVLRSVPGSHHDGVDGGGQCLPDPRPLRLEAQAGSSGVLGLPALHRGGCDPALRVVSHLRCRLGLPANAHQPALRRRDGLPPVHEPSLRTALGGSSSLDSLRSLSDRRSHRTAGDRRLGRRGAGFGAPHRQLRRRLRRDAGVGADPGEGEDPNARIRSGLERRCRAVGCSGELRSGAAGTRDSGLLAACHLSPLAGPAVVRRLSGCGGLRHRSTPTEWRPSRSRGCSLR
jgi:hypothetical protein